MRLATRTAFAAAAAGALALAVVGILFRNRVGDTLRERVDRQLEERASTAPILAAVGTRLSVSELGATVEGARVLADGSTVALGALPDDPLPPVTAPGWQTVRADDQNDNPVVMVVNPGSITSASATKKMSPDSSDKGTVGQGMNASPNTNDSNGSAQPDH